MKNYKVKIDRKKLLADYLPIVLTGAFIIYFAITREQRFIKVLPTVITLIAQLLNAKANRLVFLIGGANTVLYGISYLTERLYFSAFWELAISAPFMFVSYFLWKRNSFANKPKLRKLPLWGLVASVVGVILFWLMCVNCLGAIISSGRCVELDALYLSLGLMIAMLTAMRYIEAQYLNVISCSVLLAMWICLTVKDPRNLNFVIICMYNLFRVVQAAINWTEISKNGGQNNEN